MCKVIGCGRKIDSSGFCSGHRARNRKGQSLEPPLKFRTPKGRKTCSIENCDRVYLAGGYCNLHYQRAAKGMDLGAPPKLRRDKNGGPTIRKDKDGYLVYWDIETKRVDRVHRKIMKDILGRDFLPEETVHHKNGVRDDNNVENLELWSKSQPAGQRVIDKIAWAKELLALYEPEALK